MSSDKAMAPHSSTLAWRVPWMEEPGGLQSMGSLRVRHDWVTSLSLFTFMHWRRKWQPTPVFLPGESQGRGAWWAAVYGVTQSQTWLKRLSSSSSSNVFVHFPCSSFHTWPFSSFFFFFKDYSWAFSLSLLMLVPLMTLVSVITLILMILKSILLPIALENTNIFLLEIFTWI